MNRMKIDNSENGVRITGFDVPLGNILIFVAKVMLAVVPVALGLKLLQANIVDACAILLQRFGLL